MPRAPRPPDAPRPPAPAPRDRPRQVHGELPGGVEAPALDQDQELLATALRRFGEAAAIEQLAAHSLEQRLGLVVLGCRHRDPRLAPAPLDLLGGRRGPGVDRSRLRTL